MKEILQEVYRTTKKITGVDPSKPGNIKQIITEDETFKTYVEGLAESLEKKDKAAFMQLAENTRVGLLESSMFGINPYESLTLPILRVFYPKLIAKEAVTVSPMDKPECVKPFVRATFTPSNSVTQYDAPVVGTDISRGAGIGTSVAATVNVPQSGFNVLNAISAGLTSSQAHLERDFEITGVYDGTTWVDVSIVPAVEGHFSQTVTISGSTDVVSGKVDYLNGTLAISVTNDLVTSVKYKVTCSLEENRINPRSEITIDKVRLYARDRQISTTWTLNMEQDLRSLFDISIQAEMVNLLGQQIATDIDREIVNALITANTALNASNHTGSFTRTPPDSYTWGIKIWHENIVSELNELSAVIYNSTNIDNGNTILANPYDVAILEDINGFAYTGTSALDGDVGYRTATVQGGKWRILTSSIVTQGTMVMVYKPADEIKSIYFYSPYIPAILHPYPLTYTPSLTILSRYATALVRQGGIAALTIGA